MPSNDGPDVSSWRFAGVSIDYKEAC